jgi:hypothetical protein
LSHPQIAAAYFQWIAFGRLDAGFLYIMVAAQLSELGFPLLDPCAGRAKEDNRTEPCFICRGQVRLAFQGGVGLAGELLDMSANGFRASFVHPAPAAGSEVEFSHRFFHGRALVVWMLEAGGRFEAGCLVLRK